MPIVETDDGYMRVPVPAGHVRIELTYALDRFDIAARVAGIVGLAIIAMFLFV